MRTILVIDDSEFARMSAQAILKKYYNVEFAKNGISGIEKAVELKPDLILLDVLMPGMDGFETCRRLKLNDETKNIPIIFVTSMSQHTTEGAGLSMGAADYICKPYDGSIFLQRIKNALKDKTNE